MANLRKSISLPIALGLVFLLSGLVVNFLQAILYVLLYNTNRRLYRKLNYYLMYAIFSQFKNMTDWFSGCSYKLYGSEETMQKFGKEHSIVMVNHRYEIDWLMYLCFCEKFGTFGSTKCFAKKSLKYVPVFGWSWVFGEFIFLERNWEKDSQSLGARLDQLMEYEEPIALFLPAEGTRYTKEKYEDSLKFAKDNKLPQLKYHLLPRTKGFNFSVSHLKSKVNAIYDVQLAFPNDVCPTFYDLFFGEKFKADIFLRRIPMNQIPTESDVETTKFLYELYKEKDELMENYLKTSTFPGKGVELKRSLKPLFNFLFWSTLVGVPSLISLFKLLISGNTWVTAATGVGIVSVLVLVHKMIDVANADKGSSYGKTSSLLKRNGVAAEKNNVAAEKNSVAAEENSVAAEKNSVASKN